MKIVFDKFLSIVQCIAEIIDRYLNLWIGGYEQINNYRQQKILTV